MGNTVSESGVQKAIADLLVMSGWLVIRVNAGAMKDDYKGRPRFIRFVLWRALGTVAKTAGISDLIGCTPAGRFFAIECKSPGLANLVTEKQAEFLSVVRSLGGLAIVADSVDDVLVLVNIKSGI